MSLSLPRSVLLSLAVSASLLAQDPGAARVDPADALRHYAAVEAELRAAPAPADAAIAARRAQVIDLLRAYRETGTFGIDPAPEGRRVPRFIDDGGRRCAVAYLLDHTGHGELTLAVHAQANQAWVADLVGNPKLGAWLEHHGLTPAEAARIQYPSSWRQRQQQQFERAEQRERMESARRSGNRSGGEGDVVPGATGLGTSQPGTNAVPTGHATANNSVATLGTRGGNVRRGGMPLEALDSVTWGDWWEWNRAVFEPPTPVERVPSGGTSVSSRSAAVSLLERLANAPEAAVRAAAAQALGRVGVAADKLVPFLADDARAVRLGALLGLGSAGTAAHARAIAASLESDAQGEAVAVAIASFTLLDDGPARQMLARTVVDRVTDDRPVVQVAASLGAATASPDAGRTIARRLARDGETPLQRALAAQMLGDGATVEDVATLTSLANERSVDVRRSASLALGQSHHALALPALQTAFEMEHDSGTRAMQLMAMADHGGDAAGPFLRRQLVEGSKPLRAHAALALGVFGRDRADAASIAEEIVSALEAERNHDQRGAYLLALGLLKNESSRSLLTSRLESREDSTVRGAAAVALGLLGGADSFAALTRALADDSCPWVRQQAAFALGRCGGDTIDVLTATLWKEKDAGVRAAALWALGGIDDERARSALLACAGDDELPAEVRAAGASAIGRAYRAHEPRFPGLRFQQNNLLIPDITAWAFAQEL